MRSRSGQSGQAVIEFVLSLMFIMGLVVFIVNLAFNFAVGNFVHYATYMSARTLLASNESEVAQVETASKVLSTMMRGGTRFSGWITPVNGFGSGTSIAGAKIISKPSQYGFDDDKRATSWISGVLYQFDMKMFLGPISGTKGSKLTLTSESWLGREESTEECLKTLVKTQGVSETEVHIDNGC